MPAQNPTTFHFKLPKYVGIPISPPPMKWWPNIEPVWPAKSSKRPGEPVEAIKAFVVHATAGHASAHAMDVMLTKNASWHWLIPDEDEHEHGKHVWSCVPEKRAAWHVRRACHHPDVNADATHTNDWSLGVEIVNSQKKSDVYSDWQVEALASLVRYAWSIYPNLEDVVAHAKLDPQRRSDPGVNFQWPRFEKLVIG